MKQGRYDVLHSHHDIMSAVYLLASAGLPFRKRIIHVHNTSMSLPTPRRVKAALVRVPMRWICRHMADSVVGVSKDALESFIGKEAPDTAFHRVIHCAADTARFAQRRIAPNVFRRELGLAPNAKVLLFVGRIVDYKNPLFVIRMLEYLAANDPNIFAVFAGSGNQLEDVRELASQKRLEYRVRLLGFRDDVPDLMLSSDLLIWPSLEDPKEGLGLGIVEAQAAGLPVLMSRSVPEEAIVVPELVDVLPLAAGPKTWAYLALQILARSRPCSRESLAKVASSSFSLIASVSNLMALYDESL